MYIFVVSSISSILAFKRYFNIYFTENRNTAFHFQRCLLMLLLFPNDFCHFSSLFYERHLQIHKNKCLLVKMRTWKMHQLQRMQNEIRKKTEIITISLYNAVNFTNFSICLKINSLHKTNTIIRN